MSGLVYLTSILTLFGVCSTFPVAEPALAKVVERWDAAKVPTQVAFHTKGRSIFQKVRVIPSGLQNKPLGSRTATAACKNINFDDDVFLSVPKCKLSDTKCLKSSAAAAVPTIVAGIPELGTDTLDPLHLDKVDINLAGLNMILTDINVTGIKNAMITKLRVDMAKKQINVVFHMDIEIKGKYTASGQLLVLPIRGDGDCDIKLSNLFVDMTMPFEITKNAEGKEIIDLTSFTYTFDVKDGAHFHLTNLFNGDKELSENLLRFMNDNWKILTQQFGGLLLNASEAVIFESLKKFFNAQPVKDIALS